MALLDSLFSPNASAPTPPPAPAQDGGGFLGGLMGPNGLVGADLAPTVQAIGMSLLSSSRFNPLEKLPFYMQQAETQRTQAASRGALEAVLKQNDFSDQEAKALALNPEAAKLAIATRSALRGQRADKAALGILGGDLTSGASPAAPGGPASGASLSGSALAPPTGDSAAVKDKFIGALKEGGLTNPYGLGAVAAYAQHESQYAPGNVNRTWSDPSERGAAGTSGGILSWRNERLNNMQAATAGAKDPVVAQAQFTLNENPELTAKLQNAKSAEEANALMADAWQFAGYNRRDGGEYARRLATTQSYANQFGQPRTQVASASGSLPATMPPGASGLNPGQRVDVAENEQDVQRLEGKLNQYPANVYGITRPAAPQGTAVAAADLPAPGAREAEFRIPGEGGSTGGDAPTVFNDRPTAMRTLGLINRALQTPNITDDMRRTLEARRQEALAVLKPTDIQQKLTEAGFRPGTPEYQDAARRMALGDKEKDPTETVEGRKALAEQYGFKVGTPEYVNWVLGKKLPKDEEKKQLSVADRNAILKADEAVESARGVLGNLKDAMALSKKAYEGPAASQRGQLTGFFGSEAGQATTEYDNLITQTTLGQLKQIFGGNPTEGERAILLQVQGSSSQPAAVREKILQRAEAAAQRRLSVMQERADELRAGTYYQQGGGAASTASRGSSPAGGGQPRNDGGQSAPPPAAIQALRSDARLRDQFDAKYGAGAAAQALGER